MMLMSLRVLRGKTLSFYELKEPVGSMLAFTQASTANMEGLKTLFG
jgi:hypothetical protein